MRKSVFVFALCAFFVSLLPLFTPTTEKAGQVDAPVLENIEYSLNISVSAQCAILTAADGTLLFSKNAHERAEPASTTKIMTALVVLETLRSDEVITVTQETTGAEGSSLYLKAGEQLTVRELLLGMMLESGNDAAETLAKAAGGSVEGFVAMMNEKAAQMGLEDTHFENPHGLSSENHYTTAADLVKIACTAMSSEAFREYVSTYKACITGYGSDSGRLLINHNKLLRMYDGAAGVKTGYTKSSGRTLVGAAQRDGLMLISVTLNAPDDWNDHITMFDAAFCAFESVTVAEQYEKSLYVPVTGGEKSAVRLTNTQALTLVLPRGTEYTLAYNAPDAVCAPVKKDERLGEITVYAGDKAVGTIPLAASENIDCKRLSFWERIFGAWKP
ncbi:MAG TPA: D-alanyl-D-alanine carboxypeptidase family protein [Bacillota bacterium]|nr:D-alanyl-D-alanine carboxypeptidase family protein [Bacillota bacterium]